MRAGREPTTISGRLLITCCTITGKKLVMTRLRTPTDYTQRILEDLYDDRETVEKVLSAKGRIFARMKKE
jgi:hypothetical protein